MCLGLPARVIAVEDAERKLAVVALDGERRIVNMGGLAASADEVRALVGAWVVVHLGFAHQRISEAEAQASRDLLAELAAVQALVSRPEEEV